MKFKEVFSFFARAREEKEKQKRANEEHHNLVMQKIESLAKYDTRNLSNKDLSRAIQEIWNLIDYSATICGTDDDWAEDEFSCLVKLPRDYDLRVEIFIRILLNTKGDQLIAKFDKI